MLKSDIWICLLIDENNNVGAEAERDVQKNYWIEHSADLTVEAMMLDSRAADLDKEERPEVIYIYFLIKYINISVNQFNSSGLD